ncbi:hypothetical protein BLOT_010936 [Blomia tropicalis]|nr:hypothetical protein BLOT_010936 [Blomia tropicalis]
MLAKRLILFVILITFVICSPYIEIQQLLGRKRTWSSQIKNCISTCKRILYKCHKDMNYCIEGCRIRVYKPIYYCVYEQCNNRGLGVNETLHPVKYHQCVHLCKLSPRNRTQTIPPISKSNRRSRRSFLERY